MSEPAMLADHLDEQTDAILAVWRDDRRARRRRPRVGDGSRYAEFLDHVPAAARPAGRAAPGPAAPTPRPRARSTASIRWRQGYDIAEIVSEFGHLRTALAEATFEFAREHDWDLATLETALRGDQRRARRGDRRGVRQFQEDSRARDRRRRWPRSRSGRRPSRRPGSPPRSSRPSCGRSSDSLPVGVWVVDAEGTIIGAQREAERLQGFARSDDRAGPTSTTSAPNTAPPARRHRLPAEEMPLVRALRGEVVDQEEIVWAAPEASRGSSRSTPPR